MSLVTDLLIPLDAPSLSLFFAQSVADDVAFMEPIEFRFHDSIETDPVISINALGKLLDEPLSLFLGHGLLDDSLDGRARDIPMGILPDVPLTKRCNLQAVQDGRTFRNSTKNWRFLLSRSVNLITK